MRTVLYVALMVLLPAVHAGDLTVTVVGTDGQPLAGAAVVLEGLPRAGDPETVVMDQRDERFVPDFIVVGSGGAVRFPNNDEVMHHVYSFSDAASFDVPLSRDVSPSPIALPTAGLVVVGCNIHDQMIGHVLVADSDYTALTDASGQATFSDLPEGTAEVVAWMPGAGAYGDAREPVSGARVRVRLSVRKPRAPTVWDDEY